MRDSRLRQAQRLIEFAGEDRLAARREQVDDPHAPDRRAPSTTRRSRSPLPHRASAHPAVRNMQPLFRAPSLQPRPMLPRLQERPVSQRRPTTPGVAHPRAALAEFDGQRPCPLEPPRHQHPSLRSTLINVSIAVDLSGRGAPFLLLHPWGSRGVELAARSISSSERSGPGQCSRCSAPPSVCTSARNTPRR